MKTITLEFDGVPRSGLEEHLLSLNGILEVKIVNEETCVLTIKYDSNVTDYNIIKLEIITFLDIYNIPSLLSFDKHEEGKKCKYDIHIKDICCEYCFSGNIDELLNTKGIIKAYSDFDKYDNFYTENVVINIEYLEDLITLEEVKNIEEEFNK